MNVHTGTKEITSKIQVNTDDAVEIVEAVGAVEAVEAVVSSSSSSSKPC